MRASTDNARTEVLPLKVALRGALRESSEAKWGCRGSDCGAGWARGAPLLSCGAAIAVRCSPRQSVTPRPPFAHLDAQGHYYARPAIGDAYVAAHYAATQAVACPSRG